MSIDFIDLYLTMLNFLFSIYFSIHTNNITIQFDENFQLFQRCRMFRFCLFIYSYCQHHTSIFSSNLEMNMTTNSTNTRCRHNKFYFQNNDEYDFVDFFSFFFFTLLYSFFEIKFNSCFDRDFVRSFST